MIAGPTASGKSSLALKIAEAKGGIILNADALQVFDGWRLLTARPDDADLAQAKHALYGHISYQTPYSVGEWLRDLTPYLSGTARPIIVGGTGLYFRALTEGLVDIPATPPEIRAEADLLSHQDLLDGLSETTRTGIDIQNRARVQRAWEVQHATGQSIDSWQAQTPPPRLPLGKTHPIVLDAPKEWLTPRIAQRFDLMMQAGALSEAEAMRADWDPSRPSSKAIGAAELIAHLNGEMSLQEAIDRAVIITRQYAKRQRTWFRTRMGAWHNISAQTLI